MKYTQPFLIGIGILAALSSLLMLLFYSEHAHSSTRDTNFEKRPIELPRGQMLTHPRSSHSLLPTTAPPFSNNARVQFSFIMVLGHPSVPRKGFEEGSLLHRLRINIHSLSHNLNIHNVSAELIIVHWVADGREQLTDLAELISSWQLSPPLEWLRVVQVPHSVALLAPRCIGSIFPQVTYADPGIDCFEFIAKNVGARRASGRFLVFFNVDNMFSLELGSLFGKPDFWKDDHYYRSQRKSLWHPLVDSPDPQTLYDLLHHRTGWRPKVNPMSIESAKPKNIDEVIRMSDIFGGDFLALPREKFFEFGGYPEIGLDIHVDNVIMAMAMARGMTFTVLRAPYTVFHQDHPNREADARVISVPNEHVMKHLGFARAKPIEEGDTWNYSNPRWGFADVKLIQRNTFKGNVFID